MASVVSWLWHPWTGESTRLLCLFDFQPRILEGHAISPPPGILPETQELKLCVSCIPAWCSLPLTPSGNDTLYIIHSINEHFNIPGLGEESIHLPLYSMRRNRPIEHHKDTGLRVVNSKMRDHKWLSGEVQKSLVKASFQKRTKQLAESLKDEEGYISPRVFHTHRTAWRKVLSQRDRTMVRTKTQRLKGSVEKRGEGQDWDWEVGRKHPDKAREHAETFFHFISQQENYPSVLNRGTGLIKFAQKSMLSSVWRIKQKSC